MTKAVLGQYRKLLQADHLSIKRGVLSRYLELKGVFYYPFSSIIFTFVYLTQPVL